MEKVEIKQIADYVKELEEGLVEWDYRGLPILSGVFFILEIYILQLYIVHSGCTLVRHISSASGSATA